jgi:hypothetical protein
MTATDTCARPHADAEARGSARIAVGVATAVALAVLALALSSAAPTDPGETGSPPPSAQLAAARSGASTGLDATTSLTTPAPSDVVEPSSTEDSVTPTGTTSPPTDDAGRP